MELQKMGRIIGFMLIAFFLILYTDNLCYGAEMETTLIDETEEIKPVEIDIGDYQSEMTVGEKQLLTVTVLPVNTTNPTVTYLSSNETVASINGMGRITALAIGETIISAKMGKIKGSFKLIVKEKEADTEENIAVIAIDIGNYESEMEVDNTQTLSVIVMPSDATDATISYTSSDTSIATVTASGEIKGISKGTVTISISAGGIIKNIPITVKISATRLGINSTYLVLKRGEEFTLQTTVIPDEASQSVIYKSLDTSVATVSEEGIVNAVGVGNTIIVVSNSDISSAVSVIVNRIDIDEEDSIDSINKSEEYNGITTALTKVSEKESELINLINNAGNVPVMVKSKDYRIITKNILKSLYTTQAKLVVEAENYSIIIDGKEITNYENELNTKIEFIKEKEGVSFLINARNNLPGKVIFDLSDNIFNTSYLYLYNDYKKKYQMLDDNSNPSDIILDVAGKYLATDKKLSDINVSALVIIIGIACIIGLCIGYIVMKKKYWFW